MAGMAVKAGMMTREAGGWTAHVGDGLGTFLLLSAAGHVAALLFSLVLWRGTAGNAFPVIEVFVAVTECAVQLSEPTRP